LRWGNNTKSPAVTVQAGEDTGTSNLRPRRGYAFATTAGRVEKDSRTARQLLDPAHVLFQKSLHTFGRQALAVFP
jgi:hypothetical protein